MIKTNIKNHQAWVLIDRPKYKNALSLVLLESLKKELELLEFNDDVKVIVLYGEPDFSSGGDIRDMSTQQDDVSLMAKKVQDIYLRIEAIQKPLIAYVSGFVFGGGFELSLVCDFILADTTACFSLPETALGIVPGGGATQRLKARIGKQNAAFILMTGKRFSASEMLRLGIVQAIVKDKQEVTSLLDNIVAKNQSATLKIKSLLTCDLDFEAESKAFAELLSGEGKTLIQQFLKKELP